MASRRGISQKDADLAVLNSASQITVNWLYSGTGQQGFEIQRATGITYSTIYTPGDSWIGGAASARWILRVGRCGTARA